MLKFTRTSVPQKGYKSGDYFIYSCMREDHNGRKLVWNVEFKGERIFREQRKWEAINQANYFEDCMRSNYKIISGV